MADSFPLWRILLVEDGPGDVCLFRMALAEAKLSSELTVLDNGAEALAFIRREGKYASSPVPDLIVLDQMLPRFSGMEVREVIRSHDHLAFVPVVLMTSLELPHGKSLDRDCDHLIVKPLNLGGYLAIGAILKRILAETKSPRKSSAAGPGCF